MAKVAQVQLGKQGLTDNFISTLETYFKNHKIVRISVLKSAGHDKKKVKEYSEEIIGKLGEAYKARIIGFVIVLRKYKVKQ